LALRFVETRPPKRVFEKAKRSLRSVRHKQSAVTLGDVMLFNGNTINFGDMRRTKRSYVSEDVNPAQPSRRSKSVMKTSYQI